MTDQKNESPDPQLAKFIELMERSRGTLLELASMGLELTRNEGDCAMNAIVEQYAIPCGKFKDKLDESLVLARIAASAGGTKKFSAMSPKKQVELTQNFVLGIHGDPNNNN